MPVATAPDILVIAFGDERVELDGLDAAVEFLHRLGQADRELRLELRSVRRRARDVRLRLGSALLQLRGQVDHGRWGRLLDSLGLHHRTVQCAMRTASAFAKADGSLDAEAVRAIRERRRAELLLATRHRVTQILVEATSLESGARAVL